MHRMLMKKIGMTALIVCLLLEVQVYALGCYALANISEFPEHFWGDADYLYWQIQDSPIPIPLVVEGDTPVLGDKNVSIDWRSGGRFSLGCWFEEGLPINLCRGLGLDFHYLFLPKASHTMKIRSSGLPGSPNYSIPYFNVVTGEEATSPISLVGVFSTKASLTIHNQLQGAEANGYVVFEEGPYLKYGFLGGFRYLNFTETATLRVSSPFIVNPDVWITVDKFQSQNNFYGGQLGVGAAVALCGWFAEASLKLGLGALCERARVSGHLLTNDYTNQTTVQSFLGGYFTMPTNLGHHRSTSFAVVPEFDFNIGYQIMKCLKIQIGYTFLYVSEILRAGKIMNRYINPSQSVTITDNPSAQLVGEPSPKALMRSEGFWTQGVNAGLEFFF